MDGVAIGLPQIKSDTIVFRHRKQTFELPTYGVVGVFAHYNGIHYEAKLKDIRKFLKKEAKHG